MKQITTVLLIFLHLTTLKSQELSPNDQQHIRTLIQHVKANNKSQICDLVAYPLTRENPIPAIRNKKELLTRFDEVFDTKLMKTIAQSDLKTDWSAMGWRGIMLLSGDVWLNSDGKITAINYQSELEKAKKEKLILAQKSVLHPSLRSFIKPIYTLQTKTHRIRIDETANNKYRYASWKRTQTQSEKPALILQNGEINFDGSGGNHSYIFKSGEYSYICEIIILGTQPNTSYELIVTKNGTELMRQKAKLYRKK